MDYFKRVLLVAFGVLILVGITAGIYGTMAFREESFMTKQKIKENKEIARLYDSTIPVPSQKCDFPNDSSAATYSAVMRSSNLTETQRALTEDAVKFDGVVVSLVNAPGYDAKVGIKVDTVYLGLSFPNNQKDEYLKRIKKIASAPNDIENEYFNFISLASLKQDCRYALEEVKNLVIKEKIILDQLRLLTEENIAKVDWSTVFNELDNLRQDASSFIRTLDNFTNGRLNKFEVNLTIQNFPG